MVIAALVEVGLHATAFAPPCIVLPRSVLSSSMYLLELFLRFPGLKSFFSPWSMPIQCSALAFSSFISLAISCSAASKAVALAVAASGHRFLHMSTVTMCFSCAATMIPKPVSTTSSCHYPPPQHPIVCVTSGLHLSGLMQQLGFLMCSISPTRHGNTSSTW